LYIELLTCTVNLPEPRSYSATAPQVSSGWAPERGQRSRRRITTSALAKSSSTGPNANRRCMATLVGPRSGCSTASPRASTAASGSTTAGSGS
jgi:hypothetical protein